MEEPLLLVLCLAGRCTSSKLLWLPADLGDLDGAVYRRLDACDPGEICFNGPDIGIPDILTKELLVLVEALEVIELVSPISISTIGMLLEDAGPSSFVNVPWRTKGGLGLVMCEELFVRGEIVRSGDFVTLAELAPDR